MLQPYNGSRLKAVGMFWRILQKWRRFAALLFDSCTFFLFLSTFMGIISHSRQFIKQSAVARLVCVSKQIPENTPFLSESLFFTSHSLLNHFNPQGAQTLAVISSAGASVRAQNKTSVAWISFCGRMSCLGEQWVWRARRHGPPSECLPSTQQPYSERTTHLGLRGDFKPACMFWALAPFRTLFAVRPIVLKAFFAPQSPAVKLPFLKYSVKGWNEMSVHVERCPNQMNRR